MVKIYNRPTPPSYLSLTKHWLFHDGKLETKALYGKVMPNPEWLCQPCHHAIIHLDSNQYHTVRLKTWMYLQIGMSLRLLLGPKTN